MSSSAPCQMVLYVKAGSDDQRYGACPFCQRAFMVVMSKSLHHAINFTTVNINLARPPVDFHRMGLRRLPALSLKSEETDDQDQIMFDNVEDIILFLETKFPDNNLQYNNPIAEAELAVKDVFSRFCFFIKQVSKDGTQLQNQLEKLEAYLACQKANNQNFLCGNQLSHLDCELLPKLQHIRVAAAKLKNFDISPKLVNVWAYLWAAYNSDIFVRTVPSDQEIVLHWLDLQRPSMENVNYGQHKKLIKDEPKYSLDVPAFAALVNID